MLFPALLVPTSTVEVRIEHGRFALPAIELPSDGILRFRNADRDTYTVEAPGLLPGDVTLDPGETVEVKPLYEAGRFIVMIEEVPASTINVVFAGRPFEDPSLRETPFDAARRRDRQPLLFDPGQEPAYGAYTTFDLSGRGEAERQAVLQALYKLQESLSAGQAPADFALYLTPAAWNRLRPSIALTIGLGPTAYDPARFGSAVAATKPKDLHPFALGPRLGAKLPSGRDLMVRIVSDSHWFNLRACRLVWGRLHGQIVRPTLESGYAPPRGRSPILGGFFDGVGNPSGDARDMAVYGKTDGTIFALFRIRFDEERFASLDPATQEALIGRRKGSGHLIAHGDPAGHRERAQNDGKSLIFRMPLVFDEGPGKTGLLFASAQASLGPQFERILSGFMLAKDANGRADRLLSFMRFESGAYYYVPPSPRGSYPGSLRPNPN